MAGEALTPIQEFYKDTTVFVTGGTGFMGKVLIEKLLRSCPKISHIILLVRPKEGQGVKQRLSELFDDLVFDRIDEITRQKVSIVHGDCSKHDLGLSEIDRQNLIREVNVVFHAAATVRFNEELGLAVAVNIVGTKAVIELGKEMKQLKAFVHVSTAYSNCHINEIKEIFYPPHICSNDLIKIVETLDKPLLEHLTPFLLKNVPNSYVYTKSIAEDYIRTQSKNLPIAVFRPSIIISTKNEPIAGWVDNFYGPTGLVAGIATGMLRAIYCNPSTISDIVPMDYAVNALIATAYKTSSSVWNKESKDPTIYNFVSSADNPLQFQQVVEKIFKYLIPTVNAFWYPKLSMHSNLIMYKVNRFYKHFLPALIVDVIGKIIFRKNEMIKTYSKIDKVIEIMSFFNTNKWTFYNDNCVALWDSLHPEDKIIFPFSIKELDWDLYFHTYMLGVRQYLLKDDLKTQAKGLAWHRKLFWMNVMLEGFVFMVACYLLYKFVIILTKTSY